MPKKKAGTGQREEIDTGKNKLYVRRSATGQFQSGVDEGRSLAADRRRHAATPKPRNQGDKGD
jgi:hypothetical protein